MKVRELIEALQGQDPSAEAYYYDGTWDMGHPVEIVVDIRPDTLGNYGPAEGVLLICKISD